VCRIAFMDIMGLILRTERRLRYGNNLETAKEKRAY
jgi:hypothetical protein